MHRVLLLASALLTSSCAGLGLWLDDEAKTDSYAAFRGRFELSSDSQVEIRTLGSSWFVAWLDGEHFTEGPHRFERGHPEYEAKSIRLTAGSHVLAAQVHHVGADTRILQDMPPFFLCELRVDGRLGPVRALGFRPIGVGRVFAQDAFSSPWDLPLLLHRFQLKALDTKPFVRGSLGK